MLFRKSRFLSFFLILTLFSATALAADFHSPRSLALGGSGHAGPILNDAIYMNPSFASFLQSYSVSGSFLSYSNEASTYRGRTYGISIHDGRTKMFQAGLGYSVRESGALFTFGASKALVQRFGVGVGAKLFFPNIKSEIPFQDINVSSSFVVSQWLQMALIADNLFESKGGSARGMAREVIFATKVNFQNMFVFYVDPHVAPSLAKDQKWGYEVGVEWGIMRDLYLRGGLFSNSQVPYQSERGNGFAFGGGWTAPKLSLDYGFSRVLANTASAPPSNIHTFGATVYF